MAGAGRKVFAPGDPVTEPDFLDTYLMQQMVMVFTAGTAAAGSAIGTALAEGMVIYGGTASGSSSGLYKYDGTSWKAI
jgi:hypothetical protein